MKAATLSSCQEEEGNPAEKGRRACPFSWREGQPHEGQTATVARENAFRERGKKHNRGDTLLKKAGLEKRESRKNKRGYICLNSERQASSTATLYHRLPFTAP